MSLLPAIAQFLHRLNHELWPALQAQGFKTNVINAREGLATLTARFVTRPQAVARIQDDTLPVAGGYAVPVRIYHPQPQTALPVLVYLHGGGGVCGSVSVYDGILRRLAVVSGHIVLAPEYRLAPENPYPAGLNDALATVRGALALLQHNHLPFAPRLALGGDSAGGALASAVCLQAQHDDTLEIAAQVLVYPSVDFCMTSASVRDFGSDYLLTAERMRWYFAQYFQHSEDYCAASSLHAPVCARHVPTLIVTAGHDPLRDEGRAYADKLRAAGVVVQYHEYADLIHAFLNLEDLCPEACANAYARIGAFLAAPEAA